MGDIESQRHESSSDSSLAIAEEDEPPSSRSGGSGNFRHVQALKNSESAAGAGATGSCGSAGEGGAAWDAAAAAVAPPPPPHTLSASELAAQLETSLDDGLSTDEAAARLERDGPNKVEGAKGNSLWQILVRQVSNALTLVLVAVMVLSFAIDDYLEGGVISAVIVLNIIVGYGTLTRELLHPS